MSDSSRLGQFFPPSPPPGTPLSLDMPHVAVPFFYINAIAATTSLTDLTLVGAVNDRPQVMVCMTHAMAKSVAQNILDVLTRLERETGIVTEDQNSIMERVSGFQAKAST